MVKSCECAVSWHVYCIAATCFMTCSNVCLKIMRLTKKALLLLLLTEKYSFTLSKLRFFGLRKPKNSSFYPTSLQTWVTHFTFGSPTCINQENLFFYFLTGVILSLYVISFSGTQYSGIVPTSYPQDALPIPRNHASK